MVGARVSGVWVKKVLLLQVLVALPGRRTPHPNPPPQGGRASESCTQARGTRTGPPMVASRGPAGGRNGYLRASRGEAATGPPIGASEGKRGNGATSHRGWPNGFPVLHDRGGPVPRYDGWPRSPPFNGLAANYGGKAFVENLAVLGENSHAAEAIDRFIGDARQDDDNLIPNRPVLSFVVGPHLRWEAHFAGQLGVWKMVHHPGLGLLVLRCWLEPQPTPPRPNRLPPQVSLSWDRSEEAGAGVWSPATPCSERAPDGAEVHSQRCEPLVGTLSRVATRPERSTVGTSGGAGGAPVAPRGAFPEGGDRWRRLSPGVCTPGYGLPTLRGSEGNHQTHGYRST